ncbi:MAG: hypothetical protein V3U16_03150 [Candidatus Neomarinimicrobiota bacterium]
MSISEITIVRRYIVGIQYNSRDEDKGYFDVQRYTTITELAKEIHGYLVYGKTSYPAFAPDAEPEVLYVWNMDDWEDGDCYPDLMNEIQKNNK